MEGYKKILFFTILLIVYFLFDFQSVLFLKPQGLHFMRQTDSLSFAATYFNYGFDFFSPKVFNLQSVEGKAACEFPILYYLAAVFKLFFNNDVFILRLITLFVSSFGFFYLFRLLFMLFKDLSYALIFTFLFISSTILLNYSINFLPDPSALGFTLMAWFYFYKYLQDKKSSKSLIWAFLFFTLASLLKVTFFIHPFSAILTLFFVTFSKKNGIKIFIEENKKGLLFFCLSFSIVAGWNYYMIHYNAINQVKSFLYEPVPIWNLSKKEINDVWNYMSNYWFTKYYYQTTFHVFYLLLLLGLVFIKRGEKLILIPTFLIVCGTISLFLLFYPQFKEHDYYFISLIPAIIFLISSSFITLKNRFPKLINHFSIKSIFTIICFLSLNYAGKKLTERISITDDIYASIGEKLSNIEPLISSLNIPEKSKFVIVPDLTPNGALYFINHQGWNIQDSSENSVFVYHKLIKMDADFILFVEKSYYQSQKFQSNSLHYLGEKNGVTICEIRKK